MEYQFLTQRAYMFFSYDWYVQKLAQTPPSLRLLETSQINYDDKRRMRANRYLHKGIVKESR